MTQSKRVFLSWTVLMCFSRWLLKANLLLQTLQIIIRWIDSKWFFRISSVSKLLSMQMLHGNLSFLTFDSLNYYIHDILHSNMIWYKFNLKQMWSTMTLTIFFNVIYVWVWRDAISYNLIFNTMNNCKELNYLTNDRVSRDCLSVHQIKKKKYTISGNFNLIKY